MEECGDFECLIGTSLVLFILARLDLHSLFKARCVCRSWYSLVFSQHFLAIRKGLMLPDEVWGVIRARLHPSRRPHIDVIKDHRDSSLSRFSRMELWRLDQQQQKRIESRLWRPPGLPLGAYSSNGLVCSRIMEEDQHYVFIVGNPVTNLWKKLPPAPFLRGDRLLSYLTMSFFYDVNKNSYRILAYDEVVDSEDFPDNFETAVASTAVVQYESQVGIWRTGPGFDYDQPEVDDLRLLFKAGLFWGIWGTMQRIAAYNPKTMSWWNVALPSAAPCQGHTLSVHFRAAFKQCQERRLIVPSISLTSDHDQTGFEVWCLEVDGGGCGQWMLLSSMSIREAFGDGWEVHIDVDFKFDLVGDWVIFSSWYKSFTFGTLPPLAYNLETGKWRFYPTECNKHLHDLECCYAFVPSLTAQP